MRAKVSLGPPRQAAQEGDAGGTHPAAVKISAAVLPSHPGTGCPYTSAHTWTWQIQSVLEICEWIQEGLRRRLAVALRHQLPIHVRPHLQLADPFHVLHGCKQTSGKIVAAVLRRTPAPAARTCLPAAVNRKLPLSFLESSNVKKCRPPSCCRRMPSPAARTRPSRPVAVAIRCITADLRRVQKDCGSSKMQH